MLVTDKTNFGVYEVRKPLEVLSWILKHPTLLFLLWKAPLEIQKYFTYQTLILEVIHDPECCKLTTLNIDIPVSKNADVDEVLNTLYVLDENWWIEAVSSKWINSKKISLNIRFEVDLSSRSK